ncbi:MAG: hypothetical protein A3K66_01785 [Euryarchaeota archaeon RBG_16_67_27]|nr:MAG: hypothetical protein A3K66_01785 [Euryarchaeota archaeon RBG_16_67_27]
MRNSRPIFWTSPFRSKPYGVVVAPTAFVARWPSASYVYFVEALEHVAELDVLEPHSRSSFFAVS